MNFQRRPYQDRIIKETLGYFAGEQIRSVLIESPTGSGKTFMGLQIANDLAKENPDLLVVWVAMGRELLHQCVRECEKFGIEADVRVLSMFDKQHRKQLGDYIEGTDRPVLLVLDEAQHDAATNMTDTYQTIKPDYVLGLSATPYRVDKANLCFEKQIRDAGIHRLISDGYLSKFNLHVIEEWTPQTVVDNYLADPDKWGQSVFYWLTTDLATECTRLLKEANIRVEQIFGGQDNSDELARFRAQETQALVNCMVLTEGFDCPELQTAWVRDSSKGPTIQMCGRAYRIHKVDGKPIRKHIVQSQNTRWSITRTATPEEQYVKRDGQWLSVKPNHRTEQIVAATLKRTVVEYEPLPDFIRKKAGKGKPVDMDWFGQR